ncbi:hypothetical protein GJ744_011026 [Endocarpon pusillum]|uniref:Transcription initiation factor TFIID subunit 4 n=1 Tax=Endocarpon pusillum TaxID=364733 RepID=A0A8H7AFN2_9EURO|nr:hypothetical protein GJ744_011026 [Endocarpon pusillum]
MPPRQPPPYQPPSNAFSPSYGSPSTSFLPNMSSQLSQTQFKRQTQYSGGTQSPVNSPHFASVSLPRANSPPNSAGVNGFYSAPAAPGSMGPPSRPADKATDIRTLEDPLAGTGVNLDEEERNLTSSTYYSQHQGANTSFGSQGTTFGPGSGAGSFERPGSSGYQNGNEENAEDMQRRGQAEADFSAGRWAQHPLWDAFLQGDSLGKRLDKWSYENGIKSPKDGLFYATKGQMRPQTTRVTGHDGASLIIDRGQTIISTESGDVLGDIMKLVSLATRDRITGLLDHSARLACERRDHSAGRVPTDWKAVAITPPAPSIVSQSAVNAAAPTSLKRTFSQMDEEQPASTAHQIVSVFQKVSNANRASEQARLAKRAKRGAGKPADIGVASGAATPSGVQTPIAAPAEPPKRLTKKDKKAAETKLSGAQQQKSANETARMAMGLGSSNKFKKYSWLQNGGAASPAASPGPPPNRSNADLSSTASTLGSVRTGPSAGRGKQFGEWDENDDRAVQARDVLLVLETDGKAIKALSKGYNTPEKPEKR